MKSKLLKKIITLTITLATIATIVTILPIGVSASWKQDSKGWWNTEKNSYSVGWKKLDSKWYYFDKNGYMAHNTIIDGYYINSKGISVIATKGEIPIKTPSNWVELDNKKSVTYKIDGKSSLVYDITDTFGSSESSFINGMKYGLTKVLGEVEVSEKNYNGKNATCLEYTLITDSGTKKEYDVLFFKNDKAHCFNITSGNDDFDNTKQQLEDMLNLSLVL